MWSHLDVLYFFVVNCVNLIFWTQYKTHRFRCLRVIWCVASRWSRWTWLWWRYSCGRCVAVYILCKSSITPDIGMEPKKDPIEKETFVHSHCIKDSTIIAHFLCHDHTASTVCYGYDAHLFWHLWTSPVASGIFRKVPYRAGTGHPSLTV